MDMVNQATMTAWTLSFWCRVRSSQANRNILYAFSSTQLYAMTNTVDFTVTNSGTGNTFYKVFAGDAWYFISQTYGTGCYFYS